MCAKFKARCMSGTIALHVYTYWYYQKTQHVLCQTDQINIIDVIT